MQRSQRWGRWNPADLDAKPQWGILARLVRYGWRHQFYMAGAFLTMTGATVSAVIIPQILGSAIDEADASGLRSQFLIFALVILAVSALRAAFSYGQNYLSRSRLSEVCVRPAQRLLPQAPEPQFRLPRQAADREPDVQGHRRCRGGPQVHEHGPRKRRLYPRNPGTDHDHHALRQLAARAGMSRFRAPHSVARHLYVAQAALHVDARPGGDGQPDDGAARKHCRRAGRQVLRGERPRGAEVRRAGRDARRAHVLGHPGYSLLRAHS